MGVCIVEEGVLDDVESSVLGYVYKSQDEDGKGDVVQDSGLGDVYTRLAQDRVEDVEFLV